jgi:hypothetical protein
MEPYATLPGATASIVGAASQAVAPNAAEMLVGRMAGLEAAFLLSKSVLVGAAAVEGSSPVSPSTLTAMSAGPTAMRERLNDVCLALSVAQDSTEGLWEFLLLSQLMMFTMARLWLSDTQEWFVVHGCQPLTRPGGYMLLHEITTSPVTLRESLDAIRARDNAPRFAEAKAAVRLCVRAAAALLVINKESPDSSVCAQLDSAVTRLGQMCVNVLAAMTLPLDETLEITCTAAKQGALVVLATAPTLYAEVLESVRAMVALLPHLYSADLQSALGCQERMSSLIEHMVEFCL